MTELLQNISVMIAAGTAIYGITAWRRELRGRRRYELAEEVLALFYEAQDKIRAIRSPLGWSREGQSRKVDPKETPEEKRILDQAHVVFERYQNTEEVFNRLYALRYRFMALFGKDKVQPFEEIRSVLNKIFVATRMWANTWRRANSTQPARQEQILKNIEEYESIFWWSGKDDKIEATVQKAVDNMDQICSQILRPGPTWVYKVYETIANKCVRWLQHFPRESGHSRLT